MIRNLLASLAFASLAWNCAWGQASGVALEENDAGLTGRENRSIPAVLQTPGAQLPPPGGNPLWGIPVSALTATRERPVFSASRRPPAPPAPAVEAPPPSPPPPERPSLSLVGTVLASAESEGGNVALVIDQSTKNLVRLHVGEAIAGWSLRSVDSRKMTLQKDSQTVTLAFPVKDMSAANGQVTPDN